MACRGHSWSIILRSLESRCTTSCRRIVILASALNVPKLYAPDMTKKRVFVTPLSFDAQLLRNPLEYLNEPYTA